MAGDEAERRSEAHDASAVLSNVRAARIRAVAALGRRSMREREGLFLAEGPQAIREAVRHRPAAVREIFADPAGQERHGEILQAARDAEIPVRRTTPAVLAAMSRGRVRAVVLVGVTGYGAPYKNGICSITRVDSMKD